jgi:hypothetical protein
MLIEIAQALLAELKLVSCEPDLGIDAYRDPDEIVHRRPESAVVDRFCWAQNPVPENKMWALQTIRAPGAWAVSAKKGEGILVFQPDTGVADHDELQGALKLDLAADIMDGDNDPTDPLDPGTANPGHGTGTASVVASRETGQVVGSAPKASVVPIRCISDVKVFDAAPVAAAINHARNKGAHVITMSLGGIPSRAVHAAIKKAVAEHIVVLAAAGNCVNIVVWPARYGEVIAVAGINIDDRPWIGSSNGGAVDISAPGEFVWRAKRNEQGEGTGEVSAGQGTSFAVAITAGVAALWLAHFGRAAVVAEAQRRALPVQLLFKAALQQTARAPAGWDAANFGPGIVNAEALLKLPLAQIDTLNVWGSGNESVGFLGALRDLFGGGNDDPEFDWARHGQEIGTLLVADAKAGRSSTGPGVEARSTRAQASHAFQSAAAESRDARLAALALRVPKAPTIVIPPAAPPPPRVTVDLARAVRALGREPGSGPESAATITVEAAQRRLASSAGRKALLDSLERRMKTGSAAKPESAAARQELLGVTEQLVVKLGEEGEAATLTTAQKIQVEALVRLHDRPATPVLLRDSEQTIDALDPDLETWSGTVQGALPFIKKVLPSVGRIDGDHLHRGTGFVVAPGLVMTNRHVLETIAAPVPRSTNPASWVFTSLPTINFAHHARGEAQSFKITDVVFAGPAPILGLPTDFQKLDMALLAVETTNAAGANLPPPLKLGSDDTLVGVNNSIFTVGYPAALQEAPRDELGQVRRDVVDRLAQLFGIDYGSKFFAPGTVMHRLGNDTRDARRWAFDHDATTLGGNSGSCVIFLGSGFSVVGLHFAGDWSTSPANWAHGLLAVKQSGQAPKIDGLIWV